MVLYCVVRDGEWFFIEGGWVELVCLWINLVEFLFCCVKLGYIGLICCNFCFFSFICGVFCIV